MPVSDPNGSSAAFSALCVTTAALFATCAYLWKKSRQYKEAVSTNQGELKPQKWVKVGRVNKLIVYPVKSCQGVLVDKAVITTLGLKCTKTMLLLYGNSD